MAFLLLILLVALVILLSERSDVASQLYFDADIQVDEGWVAGEKGAREELGAPEEILVPREEPSVPTITAPEVSTPTTPDNGNYAEEPAPSSDAKSIAFGIYKDIKL